MSTVTDHTTGDIYGIASDGSKVRIGNTMSPPSERIQECCMSYGNKTPISWYDDSVGVWKLAWRCTTCKRTLNCTINARSMHPSLTDVSVLKIPGNAVTIDHEPLDLLQLQNLLDGVGVYDDVREAHTPDANPSFEGACELCTVQFNDGVADNGRVVFQCTTCFNVYMVDELGRHIKYFGHTSFDDDEIEDAIDMNDTDTNEVSEQPVMENNMTTFPNDISAATANNVSPSITPTTSTNEAYVTPTLTTKAPLSINIDVNDEVADAVTEEDTTNASSVEVVDNLDLSDMVDGVMRRMNIDEVAPSVKNDETPTTYDSMWSERKTASKFAGSPDVLCLSLVVGAQNNVFATSELIEENISRSYRMYGESIECQVLSYEERMALQSSYTLIALEPESEKSSMYLTYIGRKGDIVNYILIQLCPTAKIETHIIRNGVSK